MDIYGQSDYPFRINLLIFASLISVIAFPILAFGQAGTSEVKGFVTDESGMQLPGVSVSLKNIDTGVQVAVSTDNNGYYRIASVAPGNYEITASLPGFSTQLQSGYVFEVGSVNSIDLKMTIAGVKETITVFNETPLIERTESEIKTVVTQRQLQAIPLNGRDFQEMSVLAPGTKVANGGSISVGSSSAGQGNNVMIDGGENNDDTGGGWLQGLSVDAIQEFEVITSRFKAEFGKASGAVINAVTKSGTNEFHGNAFEFFRDDTLSARTQPQKDQDLEKPDYSRHMFGASLGGPLAKDKTHFFLNFERLNEDANTTLSGGPAQEIFEAMGEEFGTLFQPLIRDFLTAKLTHQMGDDHSFIFRYALEKSKREGDLASGNSAKSLAAITENLFHSFLVRHTYLVSSNILNEFLFQYTYSDLESVGVDQANFDTPAGPLLLFPSAAMGQNFGTPQENLQEHFQFKNDFSYYAGKHDIKTGFDVIHAPRFLTNWKPERLGTFFFPEDPVIPGVYPDADWFRINYGDGIAERANTQLGLYFQDDWRLTDRLTLNLGLRYDIEFGTLSNVVFDNELLFLMTEHPNSLCPGCRLKDDTNNIAPRLGFAFDTKGDGSTVIRGGWGIYFDQTILIATWVTDFRRNNRQIFIWDPPFGPENIPPLDELIATYGSGSLRFAIPPKWSFPSVQQASVGFSRQFSENIALDVDFLYSKGSNLPKSTNPNEFQVPFDPTSRRWFPHLQENLSVMQSIGKDEYIGLQLALRKRFSGKLQMEAHYTLGKVEGNSDWVSYELLDSYKDIGSNIDIGPLRNDVRHRFVLSSILELPAQFQFSTLIQAESARPITAYTIQDVNGNGNAFDFAPSPSGEPPGRGNFRGDPTYWVDIRLSKTVPIEERRLELMLEIFNLFNIVNYGNIYNDIIDFPNFGEALGALVTPQFEAQLGIRFTF